MRTRGVRLTTLGGTGLRIPRIGLGCRKLGSHLTGDEAVAFVRAALDHGLTFFDTADIYADGESERLLGQALSGERDRCIIATKFRHGAAQPGASRKSIRTAVDGSLRRLRTDYIDLYQLHAPDPATPIEETIHALQDLVRTGKILYFGLCNVAAWQLADAQRVAWASGPAPLASVQAVLNAVDHARLAELRPAAVRFGVGILAASPLARGLLGGRYDRATPPAAGHDLLSRKGSFYWSDRGFAALDRVRAVADSLGLSPAQAALAALLAQPGISAAIVGATSRDHLRACREIDANDTDPSALRALLSADSPMVRAEE